MCNKKKLQAYKDLLLGNFILTVNKKVNLLSAENTNFTIVNLCNIKILGLKNFLN